MREFAAGCGSRPQSTPPPKPGSRGLWQHSPGYADALAVLGMLYREEYTHNFNLKPDPLGRALAVARRAIEAAPSNHLAYHALASAQFFPGDLRAFRVSAEKAVALNPADGFTSGYLGMLLAFAGDWERGCALNERARNLNPHHPGWYWFPAFFDAYRKRDYRTSLGFAHKVRDSGARTLFLQPRMANRANRRLRARPFGNYSK